MSEETVVSNERGRRERLEYWGDMDLGSMFLQAEDSVRLVGCVDVESFEGAWDRLSQL